MSLRDQAESDLALILEDETYGFGISATITNPAGTSAGLIIQSGDVHMLFDPQTEVSVNNRTAHASVRIASLEAANLGMPRAQPKANLDPWIFEFQDANGKSRKFTVQEARPDRTLGLVTVILELMRES